MTDKDLQDLEDKIVILSDLYKMYPANLNYRTQLAKFRSIKRRYFLKHRLDALPA